jgi:hypothetical protein
MTDKVKWRDAKALRDRIEELEAEVVKAREEGRRAGLEEAAALAEKMDGEWFQNTYRASYHKKRYMAAEVEWMTRKPLHILSEDITDAIRALIPPAGGEE